MPLKAKFINASLRDIGEVLLKRTSTKRSLKVTIQILYMYLYNGENAIKNQDPSAPCTRNGKIEECPVSYVEFGERRNWPLVHDVDINTHVGEKL